MHITYSTLVSNTFLRLYNTHELRAAGDLNIIAAGVIRDYPSMWTDVNWWNVLSGFYKLYSLCFSCCYWRIKADLSSVSACINLALYCDGNISNLFTFLLPVREIRYYFHVLKGKYEVGGHSDRPHLRTNWTKIHYECLYLCLFYTVVIIGCSAASFLSHLLPPVTSKCIGVPWTAAPECAMMLLHYVNTTKCAFCKTIHASLCKQLNENK